MRYWIVILFTLSIAISQDEGYIDSTMIRNPKIAWKLGLIPGLGQLYNGKYLKAVGFIAAEYFAVSNYKTYNKDNRIRRRNTYAWWVFGLYVWNMLDAYVDAQLSTFPVKRLKSNNEVDSLKVPVE